MILLKVPQTELSIRQWQYFINDIKADGKSINSIEE